MDAVCEVLKVVVFWEKNLLLVEKYRKSNYPVANSILQCCKTSPGKIHEYCIVGIVSNETGAASVGN